ncbi:glutathione S-transferase family protein [Aspergillus undulatus]|uniref:glutathione S-transferase family protein n=1 Tax=Aspergillus undulatus TaxID=1810928 RepID=UPI003CCCC8F8
MANNTPVHFFDLLSELPGKSWSPSTFKTRLAMNYKGIPYTQSFISYPDIAPLLTSLSVPPHPEGGAHTAYTLPAIIHPSVTSTPTGALMDSLSIARHLDEQFPERPLFPSGDASYALAVAADRIMHDVAVVGYGLLFTAITDHLDPRGREYFIRTRAEMFGKPVAEMRPTDEERVKLIEKMKEEMKPVVDILKGRDGKKGPFLEGQTLGYADLVVQSYLTWFKIVEKGIWRELIELGDGKVKAFWDACYPWVEGHGEDKDWEVPRSH